MGKTRDGTVRDIYLTDPWQISVRIDRQQRAIIRGGWRLNLLKNVSFSWNPWRIEAKILFKNLSFCWNPWRHGYNPWRMEANILFKNLSFSVRGLCARQLLRYTTTPRAIPYKALFLTHFKNALDPVPRVNSCPERAFAAVLSLIIVIKFQRLVKSNLLGKSAGCTWKATRSWSVDWDTYNWSTTPGTRTANSCYIS